LEENFADRKKNDVKIVMNFKCRGMFYTEAANENRMYHCDTETNIFKQITLEVVSFNIYFSCYMYFSNKMNGRCIILENPTGESTDRVTEPASAAAPAGTPLAIVVPSGSRYQAYF